MLVALLTGRMPGAAKCEQPDLAFDVADEWTDRTTLLLPPAYAYDYHSFFGKTRMRAWLARNPGGRFGFGVDTSPVDLRWAGGLVPLFWRVQAWQHGGRPALDALRWHQLDVERETLRRFEAWCDWWPEDAVS